MKSRISQTTGLLILAMFVATAPAYAALTLQIDSTGPNPDDWDENQATQTGSVGSTPVSATTTRLPWNGTFTNDNGSYSSSSLYGTLAQPAGTTGDFFNIRISEGDIFSTTVVLGGSLLDPIFYIGDIDAVDATVAFPSGGSIFQNNADGSFSGDTLTALSGAGQGTQGAFGAVQYTGLFAAGTEFKFDFSFDTNNFSAENVGLGIAARGVGVSAIPEPATVALLAMGVGFLFFRRKK